jgi:hypothetical protein
MQPTGPAPTTANRVGLNEDGCGMAFPLLLFFIPDISGGEPSRVQRFNGSAVKLIYALF